MFKTGEPRAKNVAQLGPNDLFSLINNLPGMAYRCRYDKHWTLEFASEGCFDLTGAFPVSLINNRKTSFRDLIHPHDREAVHRGITSALEESRSYDLIYRILTVGGQEKWVRDMGRVVFLSKGKRPVMEGFITDITDRKQTEKRIQRQVRRFEALRRIDIAITASFDLRMTLDILLDQVIDQLGVDAADILLFNPDSQQLEFAAGRGLNSQMENLHLRFGEGLAGTVALERHPIYVSDLVTTERSLGCHPPAQGQFVMSYVGVPLVAKGQVKGVLEVYRCSPFSPDPEWLSFLEALAGQAAIAVDNTTLFNELQRSNTELNKAFDATLEGWSKALELRDLDTEEHTRRVTDMTVRLAHALDVKDDQIQHIRRGALLHDIGKMGIPDSILLKPGPLTSEEWQIMRQHPEYAYKLLWPIPNLRPAIDIPYCHHEKWNGSGYPRRLKGVEIPLAARIFAVVDVWDALLSDRPYRSAWREDEVFNYIREQSGEHFDPRIVSTFLTLF